MGLKGFLFSVAVLAAMLPGVFAGGEEPVSFSRDIRPILSDRCFKCHGFDPNTREADLALHTLEFAKRGKAIVPGDAGASELIARVAAPDPGERMPPPEANKPALSDAEIEIFRRWIDQGAPYEDHWAFVPPRQGGATPPESEFENPIDAFVEAKLREKGLEFSPSADPYTLVRRIYFDLLGIPPTVVEADDFVSRWLRDPGVAVDSLVDDLMERPEYGERWAREWLDLVRYADTNGYEKDRERSIWPYRDWVIRALNEDKPYDLFSIEQIAGDLIPGATLDQRIATGFHRNTMLNEEGGIDPLEFRYHAMIDRVNTTGTIWLGLTVGCAQCHTHKFDPITQTDYYSMMALLNNASEPAVRLPDPEVSRKRAEIEQQITELRNGLIRRIHPLKYGKWYRDAIDHTAPWTVLRPTALESSRPHLTVLEDGSVFATGDFTKREVYDLTFDISSIERPVTAIRLEPVPDPRLPGGGSGVAYYEGRPGDFFLSEVEARVDGERLAFASGSVDFGKIETGFGTADPENVYDGDATSGWATGGRETERHELVLNLEKPVRGKALDISLLFQRHFAAALGRFRISVTSDLGVVLARGGEIPDLSRAGGFELVEEYVREAPEFEKEREEIEKLRRGMPEFPEALVMEEWRGHTRPTHRHHRGEYLQPKEAVSPAIPALFGALPEDEPANRLTFATWLVSEENPLAARVAVNRAWRAFFGRGLVDTPGDFGFQAPLPSHPELLDFLAVTFMDEGWSLKRLHRLICTSRTYHQQSIVTPQHTSLDPENVFLARGPRFRMTGEMIRDNALATSGLLVQQLGGPSVRPPQPENVTAHAYGAPRWTSDTGEKRYRRSLYTFSKRTAPFAAYLTFDGPTGESCLPRRERSNTPLQALTLLNDLMFTEAARAIVSDVEGTDEEIALHLFRKILIRYPEKDELDLLVEFFRNQKARLESCDDSAARILGSEDCHDSVRLAAWMLVARALYNLDETITKG